jgi:two-component system, LytTR family, sensor histidine kinase AlgZ
MPKPMAESNEPATDAVWTTTVAASDLSAPRGGLRLGEAGSPFDVCHAGFVLRTVLLSQCVMAVGIGFGASSAADWIFGVAKASIPTLVGLLSWLMVTCAAHRLLARLPVSLQWLLPIAWGSACALGGHAFVGLLSIEPVPDVQRVAAAAAGAGVAAVFVAWLRTRSRLERPAQAAARLAELQSRIRPHFLFNTLNSAIVLVRLDPARAEAVLEDLSELFRAALEGGDQHGSATLHEEIELARRYLDIEAVRFGQRLNVKWDLDAGADGAKLPPLLLQPLVENAVRHGIEPLPEGGTVQISTRVRYGMAEVIVHNPVGTQRAIVPGHGLALRNVRERLRLMHDVAAGFRISQGGGRFEVKISVPLSN